MSAVAGIALALLRRARTGRGGKVDISLTDAATALCTEAWARAEGDGDDAESLLDGSRPCYTLYRAADGWLAVAALEPKFWSVFCAELGRADLVDCAFDRDPRVRTAVAAALGQHSVRAWVERFRGEDACVEPALSLDAVAADPERVVRGVVPSQEQGIGSPFGLRVQAEPGATPRTRRRHRRSTGRAIPE